MDAAAGGHSRQPRGGRSAAPGAQAQRERGRQGWLHGLVDRVSRGFPRDRQCPPQRRSLHQHTGQVRRHESHSRGEGRPQRCHRVPPQEIRGCRHSGKGKEFLTIKIRDFIGIAEL